MVDEEGEVGQRVAKADHMHLSCSPYCHLLPPQTSTPHMPESGKTPKLTDRCNHPGFGDLRKGSINLCPLVYGQGILLWQR